MTVALALTGWGEREVRLRPARAGPSLRNVVGGLFAMAITYAIGSALGAHV